MLHKLTRFTLLCCTILLAACNAFAPIGTLPTMTVQPTMVQAAAPTATVTLVPTTVASTVPTLAPTANKDAETFKYIPGGPNYAWSPDGVENLNEGWTRIRRAANGQYLPWSFLVKLTSDREIGEKIQWDSATKLEVFGPISAKLEIKRDLESSKTISPDPYDVANAKNSPLGLGWFVTGVGSVKANDVEINLTGPGVKQFAFPKDFAKTWVIFIKVPENGVLTFNLGERLTPNDNWPLPTK